ncbi:MAG: 2-oxoacid:acceptor oxidoreductase subunit alpha [Oligoflexales bacterium]
MANFGVNDFVVRFANVNGTGSATANSLVAKTIFRMGVPIGPKNMFPSNIQGLPTWYEIRINGQGFTGRRGGVDLMIAMNAQTMAQDTKDVVSGGYLLYDSTKPLRAEQRRSDINYIELPITDLCRDAFTDPRHRTLLKNIVYVGGLCALLDLDEDIVAGLLFEQIGKKKALYEMNLQALASGRDYARKNFDCPLPFKVKKETKLTDGMILMEGNEACGLGCVYAGATVAAWYPITPSTSLVDGFSKFCQRFRVDENAQEKNYAIVQAEDEIAAIGMVVGANWMGSRAFTATSGPGVSLMNEYLGFAYYAEIPTVLFNIQRVGPSTGMPTRTQQPDILSAAFASHGDTKHILLFPANPNECFDFSRIAFNLSDKYQTPVIVMSDLELGMNEFMAPKLQLGSIPLDRGKVLSKDGLDKLTKPYYRYEDLDGDGVPYRTLPYTHPSKGANLTRGSGHDRYGRYTEDPDLYQDNVDRILRKFYNSRQDSPAPVTRKASKAQVGIVCVGVVEEPLKEALAILEKENVQLDFMRIRSFPFHDEVKDFLQNHKQVIVLDQNRDGQLRSLLLIECEVNPDKLKSIKSYGGMPATALELVSKIRETGI